MTQSVKWLGYFLTCTPIVLFTLVTGPVSATDFNLNLDINGDGFENEYLEHGHDFKPLYSEYVSNYNGSDPISYSTMGLGPAYELVRIVFDNLFNDSPIGKGYLSVVNGSNIVLGKKTVKNEWLDLLDENKLFIIVLLPLLALIIINPFIALCYCCFCCCRCRGRCHPCAEKTDSRRRLFCSILLIFLTLGLLIGLLIAFLANKQINRGMSDITTRLERSGEESCAYLQDVSRHINHLLVINYDEMKDHVLEQASEAHKYLLLDLADVSGSSKLAELERILYNMKQASIKMKLVEKLQERLRFIGATLRDGIRGYKRNMIRYYTVLCGMEDCVAALKKSGLLSWDTSKCLHLDLLPNSTVFSETMEKAFEENLYNIPQMGIQQFSAIGEQLRQIMAPMIPPLRDKLMKGTFRIKIEEEHIRKHINKAINEIYMRSRNASKSFDEIHNMFGSNWQLINIIVCLLLLAIIILLITAIVWGMCVRKNNVGYNALLAAILLIFCAFSFITLVGVFYLMVGLVTYLGACQSDSAWTRINMRDCLENETIFEMLKRNNIYNVDDVKGIHILKEYDDDDELSWRGFKDDLSKISFINNEDVTRLNQVLEPLFPYHSNLYTNIMCKQVAVPDLQNTANSQYITGLNIMYGKYNGKPKRMWGGVSGLIFSKQDLLAYAPIEREFITLVDRIQDKLREIDSLILDNSHNFNETIHPMITTIQTSQQYIRENGVEFLDTAGKNVTDSLIGQMDLYLNMVVTESKLRVGRCNPLADKYRGGGDFLCRHLIDPINAFWLGVLLSALLLIPVLFVAHRLLCMYKVYTPPVLHLVSDDACPVCTGLPYVHRPFTLSGGQEAPKLDVKPVVSPKNKKE
ncbi:prominin-like protein [Drosophila grimshawi]|uniref:prominin-like protein n=1 Tax=Drosophila grimshawi TaxID=7222 RepID=UPI000C8701F3|nr:prominin-like protein [Drosophila grimshawi]